MIIITNTNNGSTKLKLLTKSKVLLNPIFPKEKIKKIKPQNPNTISTSLRKCQIFLYLGNVYESFKMGLVKKECVIAKPKRMVLR
jgi:hypothetical protein